MFEGLKRSPILVVRNKQNRFDNFFGMKLQKISAYIIPFAGIIFVNIGFNTVGLSQLIDNELNAFRTGSWVIMEKIPHPNATTWREESAGLSPKKMLSIYYCIVSPDLSIICHPPGQYLNGF